MILLCIKETTLKVYLNKYRWLEMFTVFWLTLKGCVLVLIAWEIVLIIQMYVRLQLYLHASIHIFSFYDAGFLLCFSKLFYFTLFYFTHCSFPKKPQPLWKHISGQQPDLWVWLGDGMSKQIRHQRSI